MTQEHQESKSNQSIQISNDAPEREIIKDNNVVVSFLRNLIKPKNDSSSLRETLEELVEETTSDGVEASISTHERKLISNILRARDLTAADIMVPRADIMGISETASQTELFQLLAEKQYSRLPVYRETLDNVIGTIHVKDIMATLARGETLSLPVLVREVPYISPAIHLLDLLLQMRVTRKHMVLVVDEFGGIDGLITIGDVIEAIVGELYDEHDPDDEAELTEKQDGTITAAARFTLDDFEARFGSFFNEKEREECDTLGGLVIHMTGRVPVRGEIISHSSGIVFEILEADPRRVKRLRIGNVPQKNHGFEK